jgi:hypothetical protein
MIIPEVAPMLTCTANNDGFLYELLLRAEEGKSAITQIRLGPYFFLPEYQPKPLGLASLGLTRGGPESGFWMHKSVPRGWSRLHWQVALNEAQTPTYLVSSGTLLPGTSGMFRLVSFFPPGGLRTGLELYRGQSRYDCGVSGPNYERFLRGEHEH